MMLSYNKTPPISTIDSVKNILDPEYVQSHTPKDLPYKIKIKKAGKKGNGLFAKAQINKNEIIAFYKIQVFRDTDYTSPTNRMYTFAVYTLGENESKVWVGDLTSNSLEPPKIIKKHYVPFWAYFSNEPTESQKPNSWIDMNTKENYKNRSRVKEGDTLIYKLIATKKIKPGKEIIWNYGESYQRDY